MRLILIILLIVISQPYFASDLSSRSYKGVKIGMSANEAELLLKSYQSDKENHEGGSCYYLRPPADKQDVYVMILDGKVARFDVFMKKQKIKTDKGIGIGSEKKDVLAAYPGLNASEHEYLGSAGEYLTVKDGDEHAIIFETYKDVVTSFRLGKYPAVGYIEGCS